MSATILHFTFRVLHFTFLHSCISPCLPACVRHFVGQACLFVKCILHLHFSGVSAVLASSLFVVTAKTQSAQRFAKSFAFPRALASWRFCISAFGSILRFSPPARDSGGQACLFVKC